MRGALFINTSFDFFLTLFRVLFYLEYMKKCNQRDLRLVIAREMTLEHFTSVIQASY